MRTSASSRRWAVGAAATALVTAAGTLALAGPAFANVDATVGGSGVTVRDCYHPSKQPYPGTTCTAQASLEAGLAVRLVCQYAGAGVGPNGDYYWDYILYPATGNHGSGEGYASDWYINTGVASYPYRDGAVPICSY